MTVLNENAISTYVGNNSATTFDFDFLINAEDELTVIRTADDGTQTTLTLNTDYSINETGNDNGSFITFPLDSSTYGLLQSDENISIFPNLAFTQETAYKNSSALNLENIENSFDYQCRLLQQLKVDTDRAIKLPHGSSMTADELLEEYQEAAAAAAVSAAAAATSEDNAETAETNAETAEAKAEQWADEDEDVEVETGKYSAKHWAAKALGYVTGIVGDLSNLITTAKSNVVSAINELALKISNISYINVKDYEAVGDRVADDTTAILNAITAARTLGYALYFPKGTYLVSDTLDFDGIDVYGAGVNKTSIKAVAYDAGDPSTDFTVISYTAGYTLENITVDGNNVSMASGLTGDNIQVNASVFGGRVRFRNVHSWQAKRDGISLTKIGYTHVHNTYSHHSGRYDYYFDACTTVNAEIDAGGNTEQYGICLNSCTAMDLKGVNEHNYGILISDTANRLLKFTNFYQEWIYPTARTTFNYVNPNIYNYGTTNRTNLNVSGDSNNQFKDLTLTGCDKSNVYANGSYPNEYYNKLYANFTDTAGTRTLDIYKDPAKASGDKVATGSRAGDGTMTISEANSSGITGSFEFAYTGDETDIVLTLLPSFVNITGDGIGLEFNNCYGTGLAQAYESTYYSVKFIGGTITPPEYSPRWGMKHTDGLSSVVETVFTKIRTFGGSILANVTGTVNGCSHFVQANHDASTANKIITFQERQTMSAAYEDRVYIKKVGNCIARTFGMYPTSTSLVGNGELFINSSGNALSYKDYTTGTIQTVNLT